MRVKERFYEMLEDPVYIGDPPGPLDPDQDAAELIRQYPIQVMTDLYGPLWRDEPWLSLMFGGPGHPEREWRADVYRHRNLLGPLPSVQAALDHPWRQWVGRTGWSGDPRPAPKRGTFLQSILADYPS